VGVLAKRFRKPGDGGGLVDEVHLAQDGALELVHDHPGLVARGFRREPLRQVGDPAQDGHVQPDLVLDVGPLDLDHPCRPSGGPSAAARPGRPGDGTTGERLGIELAKHERWGPESIRRSAARSR